MTAKAAVQDQPGAVDRLHAALASATGADDPRAAAISALADALQTGAVEIAALMREPGLPGLRAARAQTRLTDAVVSGALDFAYAQIPEANRTDEDRLAVVAVGGYGRGEMAPYSDVDLLFLTPAKSAQWIDDLVEATLYILWDLKLKVGHSVRSISECVKQAKTDITIRTSLLERRHVWGDRAMTRLLSKTLRRDLFKNTAFEFVEAKLEERDQRHARHGGSRYLVEPNVKESKGGLRDLQTLYWIAKYAYDVETTAALVKKGVLRSDEVKTFDAAERFFWTVRCHLHQLAGRAQEQLTFDHQVEIADRLGYQAAGGKRAVEIFMQDYFGHAMKVGELTRFMCTELEADQKKSRPGVGAFFRALTFGASRAQQHGFFVRDGRIDIGEESFIEEDPLNILRLFEEGLNSGALIHPNAFRMVARRLDLVEQMRDNAEANAIFMKILLETSNPERGLRRMNEAGVLGAFIPEFGRIVSLMQFNMYHHYTVDEHTIHAIAGLKRLEAGELITDLPVASRILAQGVDRAVLYVALFLHDIGKGRPEPHEEVGAEIAKSLCPRLGLDDAQTEQVEWLVRHHLVMSDFAQKRDTSDPATVRAFAEIVRSVKRLKLLLVLTALDIRAVGPNVWNNWKAQLLRALYADTLAVLDVGSEGMSRAARVAEAKDALRERLTNWPEDELDAWMERHYAPYWLGLDTDTLERLAEMGRKAKSDQVSSRFDQDTTRDATRCCLYMADHPGLFSRMAGAFALAGASVVDARTFTSSDGTASSVFWVQDKDGHPFEEVRHERLKKAIHRALRGDVVAREELKGRRGLRKREQPFEVPTTITFDNDSSDIYTVIEVDTRDRVGLLYDLTRTLAALNINISSAVITTYGEQAVDSFYVKDLFGFKIRSASKQKTIETKLREAIGRASEEAREKA